MVGLIRVLWKMLHAGFTREALCGPSLCHSVESSSSCFNLNRKCFTVQLGFRSRRQHGSRLFQIELTWERSEALFDFFKPKQLPEFDSLKTNTVSAEVRHALISPHCAASLHKYAGAAPTNLHRSRSGGALCKCLPSACVFRNH